ncbi:MAG: rubrerythrin family protein [Candidatus Cloacimonas sp.]|nr:rubrerythrin family protein [Candidatus Cloacimonadota bacterium]
MVQFKDTKTAENLMKAFAGESQARMRYTYYASTAKKQGYLQIADIFIETAENEKEHAKLFLKQLIKNGMEGMPVEITAPYPAALSDETLNNLAYAAAGENEEWAELYPAFAKMADEEGYKEIADTFRKVAVVEKRHETRFRKLHKNIQKDLVFKREEKTEWICMNCGHIHESKEAPAECPVCFHGQKYFQIFNENY